MQCRLAGMLRPLGNTDGVFIEFEDERAVVAQFPGSGVVNHLTSAEPRHKRVRYERIVQLCRAAVLSILEPKCLYV